MNEAPDIMEEMWTHSLGFEIKSNHIKLNDGGEVKSLPGVWNILNRRTSLTKSKLNPWDFLFPEQKKKSHPFSKMISVLLTWVVLKSRKALFF